MDALRGLSGGQKNMWLNQNREMILGYMSEHGAEATMKHFRMTRQTWETFLVRTPRKTETLTKADRALYISQSAIEMAREASRKAALVEQRMERLTAVVHVVYALSAVMKMVSELPKLTDLLDESDK